MTLFKDEEEHITSQITKLNAIGLLPFVGKWFKQLNLSILTA